MNCIPAIVAGVKNIYLTTPSLNSGINPAIVYAAKKCGVKKIYKTGGAHMIAALAYGTKKFEKVDNIFRHPSQIYEAIFEGVILFILLNFIFKKQLYKSPGFISALFLIFYSTFRFFIEFTREPDIQIGYILFNLTLGQLLCFLFFMFGIFLFYRKK